jgi:hypothetical protein
MHSNFGPAVLDLPLPYLQLLPNFMISNGTLSEITTTPPLYHSNES